MAEAGAADNKTHTTDMANLQEDIRCHVCSKMYSYPKTIDCLHSFCISCLRSLSTLNTNDHTVVVCPKCNCESEVPDNDFEAYPDAFHINRKIVVHRFLQIVNGSVPALCEKCSNKKSEKATSYCPECAQFICHLCVTIHGCWGEFQSHKVIPLSDLRNSTGDCISHQSEPLLCPAHSGTCTMFCETCQMEICHECIIRTHRDHNYNLSKESAAKHKESIKHALSEIVDIPQQLQLAIDQVRSISEKYAANTDTVVCEVQTSFERLQKEISARCEQLVKNAQELEECEQKPLQKQFEELKAMKTKAVDCIEFVSASSSGGHMSQFFRVEKQMKQQVKAVKEEFESLDLLPVEEPEVHLFMGPSTTDLVQSAGNVSNGSIFYAGTTGEKYFSVNEIITFFIALSSAYYKSRVSPMNRFKAEIQSLRDGSVCPARIAISGSGFAKLQCSFSERGRYSANVYINEKHITGSPYTFYVKPPPQHFQAPVKTISNLSSPRALAINAKNHVVVTEENRHSVTVFGRKSKRILSFGSSGTDHSLLNKPLGVAVDTEGNMYIADSKNNAVKKFSSNGAFLALYDGSKCSSGSLNQPSGVKMNRKGLVYVVDRGNSRVVVLDQELAFHFEFGGQGVGVGKLEDPWDVAFDDHSICYITDMKQDCIHIFSPTGEFRGRIGSQGSQKGKLNRPSGIAIDRFGRIFVSEAGNHRVSIFHVCSEFLECFSTGLTMVNPCGIAADEDGFVYVTCSACVHVF